MTKYNKNFGKLGEEIAAEYLLSHNFAIVHRNFRSKFGEIDIVAEKNGKLYFIEVKTRANLKKGKPYEAVNNRKIHQMKKAATYYLLENKPKNLKYTLSAFSILFTDTINYQLQFFGRW